MEERIGRYSVVRPLIETAFSRLYLAQDPVLGRPVVIKLFQVDPKAPEPPLSLEQWRDRFLLEGRVMARMDHPNLLEIHALGHLEDGRPYLVLPFLRANLPRLIGFDLTEDEATRADEILRPKSLPPPQALGLLRQVLAGLCHLHDNRVVHRDIKPDNILLTARDSGLVKICDFGMARVGRKRDLPMGSWIGTLDYMAPEQKADAALATDRADVYSAGALGWRMLTGRVWSGEEPSSALPAPLASIIAAALAPDPGQRPTAQQFLAALLG